MKNWELKVTRYRNREETVNENKKVFLQFVYWLMYFCIDINSKE